MARLCSVCHSPHLPAISAAIMGKVNPVEIARLHGSSKSAIYRHIGKCLGIPPPISGSPIPANGAMAAKAFTALAGLPSRDELGAGLATVTSRIDAIVRQCESNGSAALAISGLKEIRATLMAQAQLAGYVNQGTGSQANTDNIVISINLGNGPKMINAEASSLESL